MMRAVFETQSTSDEKNWALRLSITANCIFSDGFQCLFLWFINQLLICFGSSPVDSASEFLSASYLIQHKVTLYFMSRYN